MRDGLEIHFTHYGLVDNRVALALADEPAPATWAHIGTTPCAQLSSQHPTHDARRGRGPCACPAPGDSTSAGRHEREHDIF